MLEGQFSPAPVQIPPGENGLFSFQNKHKLLSSTPNFNFTTAPRGCWVSVGCSKLLFNCRKLICSAWLPSPSSAVGNHACLEPTLELRSTGILDVRGLRRATLIWLLDASGWNWMKFLNTCHFLCIYKVLLNCWNSCHLIWAKWTLIFH